MTTTFIKEGSFSFQAGNISFNKRGWGGVIMNKIYYNDFFCSKLKLAIELDGYTHEKEHTP